MINLCNYDEKITENEFKAKIDSMFMMLYISIMTDNLKRVSHLVHTSLLSKYEAMLNKLNAKVFPLKYSELVDFIEGKDQYSEEEYLRIVNESLKDKGE